MHYRYFNNINYRIFPPFLVSSSISFIHVFSFLLGRSLTSLLKFTPKYFYVIIRVIIFFFFFPDSVLFVYRNADALRKLILYPATLLSLRISSNIF